MSLEMVRREVCDLILIFILTTVVVLCSDVTYEAVRCSKLGLLR
jgi:hypothetical protein